MGLCVSKSSRQTDSPSQTPPLSPRGAAASHHSGLATSSRSASWRRPLRESSSTAGWNQVASTLRNPHDDMRITIALEQIHEIFTASATLRARLRRIAAEGGVSIAIVGDDRIDHAFGYACSYPRKRQIRLSETTASNGSDQFYQLLNTLLIELTNISRAADFLAVTEDYQRDQINGMEASRDTERLEYQTIHDMTAYFNEARPQIESLGYGNPWLWYTQSDPDHQTLSPGYNSFQEYYANALTSGHTAVYQTFYRA